MIVRPVRGIFGVAVLTASLALAGCASAPGVADRSYPGFPESLTETERAAVPFEYPAASWIEDGARFAVITYGSSSCPRVVTAIEAVSERAIDLRLEPSGGPACTADIAVRTHELTLPESVTGRPVTITLTYSDWDEPTELSLP